MNDRKNRFMYQITHKNAFIFIFFVAKCSKEGQHPLLLFILCSSSTKHTNLMSKQKILKIIVSVLIAALTALGAAIGLNSCNVVRTITNKSEFYQRGDTSVMIQTKTTESYDAKKNIGY